MLVKIILSALFILVVAALFAVSALMVGRADKAHTCGQDSCETCALNNGSSPDDCTEKPSGTTSELIPEQDRAIQDTEKLDRVK